MPISLTATPIAREAAFDTTSSNIASSTLADNSIPLTRYRPSQKLSETLPPLVFGTATLNYQFNIDPYALHPNALVSNALNVGVRAFDTSPYYGPAEEILGAALHSSEVKSHPSLKNLRREDYYILTKAGRIRGDMFDYSPSWIRHSVKRSLLRLKTTYLDVVYLHDVEFVSPDEVLSAIRTLRNIRDTNGSVRYVGICGYPVDVLASLSEMILRETGESLDIVQSYANFTIQNQQLESRALQRLFDAGVDVVPNASPLGMGLLRSQGVPVGAMGNWHSAPDALRTACLDAARYTVEQHNETLETVAVRFAMETWLSVGSKVGSKGVVPTKAVEMLARNNSSTTNLPLSSRLGVNVMGVSRLSELEDTMAVYNSIIAGALPTDSQIEDKIVHAKRRSQIQSMTFEIRTSILKEWFDHAWASPDPGFVNQRKVFGVSDAEEAELAALQAQAFAESEQEQDVAGVDVDKMSKEEQALLAAVKHLSDLERSVSASEKLASVDVEIQEKSGELTPPPA